MTKLTMQIFKQKNKYAIWSSAWAGPVDVQCPPLSRGLWVSSQTSLPALHTAKCNQMRWEFPGISGALRLIHYALGHIGLSYVLVVVVRIAFFAAFGRVPFPPEVCGRLVSQRTEALAIWRCSSGRKTLLSEGAWTRFVVYFSSEDTFLMLL